MFAIENRRGRDPLRRRRPRSQILNVDGGTGNGNYLLTIPLLNLPGRNLNLSLNLYYNSQVWTPVPKGSESVLTFDRDHGWPAPGWSLGFGKAVWVDPYPGAALHDADGTVHPWSARKGGPFYTTDGTLIDYDMNFIDNYGAAYYPNGMIAYYSAKSSGAQAQDTRMYPTEIVDANGNTVTISYVNGTGPAIDHISDTLDRVINFNYDGNRLTAITAPGLNTPSRPVVSFTYTPLNLVAPSPIIDVSPAWGIDAIYFPDSTGYWFGDTDSYTADSGIIAKVSQHRGMTIEQGVITRGTMSRERKYDYSLANLEAPNLQTYKHMTESWAEPDGTYSPPAVTTYTMQGGGILNTPRQTDTVYPDGTKVTQLMYNHPGKYDDGLVYQTMTYDPANNKLQQTSTTWEQGDYDSPRIAAVEITDELLQTTKTTYGYSSPTNQLTDVMQFDYDGTTVLRHIQTAYLADPGYGYTKSHIFNLPESVVISGPDGVASRSNYKYDYELLANTPGVVGHSPSYDTKYVCRGNITEIRRFADAANQVHDVIESRRYDITGNLITAIGAACYQSTFTYDVGTQYAYPSAVACGYADLSTAAQVNQSFIYDKSTGLPLTSTDFNGRTTQNAYDQATLRVQRVTLPTGAFIDYSYNDATMSVTQTVSDSAANAVSRTITRFNGLGLNQQVETLNPDDTWNAVSAQYDVLGRLWKRSQPYLLGVQEVMWTTFSRDALGRITSVQNPDETQTTWYYNEQQRPSSASPTSKGATVRIQSPTITVRNNPVPGPDRWYRTDALGSLAEAVEPDAYEDWPGGYVFAANNVRTSYSYNALGLLVRIAQGDNGPVRTFQYDSLGRLTAQHVPEKNATLDNTGAYVGPGGQWSDVFTYDNRSNLISYCDARGVKTTYDYAADPLDPPDPLNRLYRVSYEFTGPADPSIRPTAPVDYTYTTSGDITRLYQITTSPDGSDQAVQEYSYDTEGRLAAAQLTWPTAGAAPLVFQLDYGYDTLGRLTTETYPAQDSTTGRKNIDYSYGIGGLLSGLQVDGADYASQISYNAASQATEIIVGPTGPQQSAERYGYDAKTGLLSTQVVTREKDTPLSLGYTYWPNGQLGTLTDGGELSYLYDALARLWQINAPEWMQEYTFDEYGNRTSVQSTGKLNGTPLDGPPSLTYDPATNHITTAGFSYDAAGNLTRAQQTDGSWLRYQYDQAGRLAQVTDDNGQPLESYGYGADGKRLVTRHGTQSTYYFWDGDQAITEHTQLDPGVNPAWSRSFVYLGSRLLATFQPGLPGELVYYHHPDRLGTRLITNNANSDFIKQATLPFGTLIPGQPANPVNPIFTTYERSTITQLDYATNRNYDPGLRFTQPDPIIGLNLRDPQSLNLYSYVGNDPINRIDPTGLDTVEDPGQDTIQQGVLTEDILVIGDPLEPLPGFDPTLGSFFQTSLQMNSIPNAPQPVRGGGGAIPAATAPTRATTCSPSRPPTDPSQASAAAMNSSVSQASIADDPAAKALSNPTVVKAGATVATGWKLGQFVATTPGLLSAEGVPIAFTGAGAAATWTGIPLALAFGVALGTLIDDLATWAMGESIGDRVYFLIHPEMRTVNGRFINSPSPCRQ